MIPNLVCFLFGGCFAAASPAGHKHANEQSYKAVEGWAHRDCAPEGKFPLGPAAGLSGGRRRAAQLSKGNLNSLEDSAGCRVPQAQGDGALRPVELGRQWRRTWIVPKLLANRVRPTW